MKGASAAEPGEGSRLRPSAADGCSILEVLQLVHGDLQTAEREIHEH